MRCLLCSFFLPFFLFIFFFSLTKSNRRQRQALDTLIPSIHPSIHCLPPSYHTIPYHPDTSYQARKDRGSKRKKRDIYLYRVPFRVRDPLLSSMWTVYDNNHTFGRDKDASVQLIEWYVIINTITFMYIYIYLLYVIFLFTMSHPTIQ